MVLILTTAAILGFLAGASYLAVQQCGMNPAMCTMNTTNWNWNRGPGVTLPTLDGHVKGTMWRSRLGKDFHAFLGIPYGEIPLKFEVILLRGVK
jgi:hypothetical protein